MNSLELELDFQRLDFESKWQNAMTREEITNLVLFNDRRLDKFPYVDNNGNVNETLRNRILNQGR